ncbi:MAG: DUF1801 domain-containing protein [Erysipelotrichia bacterium]|jgi:uncharacterized protein YdhG (YjbR/CyaY superfamily)|nr:DUF1801 domain-containing protein [Erysipelotrichia bacterium]
MFEQYLQSQPVENHAFIQELHKTIMSWVPECEFSISYQIPTYKKDSKLLIHFHVYKNHIGLYPGPQTILKHHHELSGYRSSKGAIQIPRSEPFPYELLKKLIMTNLKD